MYRICALLTFLLVSCQNTKPSQQELVYEKLPESEVIETVEETPNKSQTNDVAEETNRSSVDLSAGNEEILDPVDYETLEENSQLKSQLYAQQRQIAKLRRENQVLRSKKKTTKTTKSSKIENTKKEVTKKETKSSVIKEPIRIPSSPRNSEKTVVVKKTSMKKMLEKDQDLILGEQRDQQVLRIEEVEAAKKLAKEETIVVKEPAPKSLTKDVTVQPVKKSQQVVTPPVEEPKEVVTPVVVEKENERVPVAFTTEATSEKVNNVDRKHCLRLISLPASQDVQIAEDIILFLKKNNIYAIHHTIQRFRVIDVVNIPPFGTQEAKSFQKRIHQLSYQGKLQFRDAYYTVRKY